MAKHFEQIHLIIQSTDSLFEYICSSLSPLVPILALFASTENPQEPRNEDIRVFDINFGTLGWSTLLFLSCLFDCCCGKQFLYQWYLVAEVSITADKESDYTDQKGIYTTEESESVLHIVALERLEGHFVRQANLNLDQPLIIDMLRALFTRYLRRCKLTKLSMSSSQTA